MPFQIVHNDITKMNTDAIVNAANTYLEQGGGVCGSIFTAAGAEQLRRECAAIGSCAVGHAIITKGYQLPAKSWERTLMLLRLQGSSALMRSMQATTLRIPPVRS